MCWNQSVSLNTFIFGVFALIMIWFNNKYSQYKTDLFKNGYAYFFFLSFMLMQLIEFFLWRNLNNKDLNHILSVIGMLLVMVQPIASLLMLEDKQSSYKIIAIYSFFAAIFFIYQFNDHRFTTEIAQNGHLKWNWNIISGYSSILYLFWLILLYYSLIVSKNYLPLIYVSILFIISYYTYSKDGTAGSLWCW
jgi:hypothetical protein